MMDFAIDGPTVKELTHAHHIYAEKELRGTDEYSNAQQGVEQGFRESNLSVTAKAIATLLKSWNKNYYQFCPAKKALLESDVKQLIDSNLEVLKSIRGRSITSITGADRGMVLRLFVCFAKTLGPVGSAKALNLIAPSFFPLWDDSIAYCYGVSPTAIGYAMFMLISKFQVEALNGTLPDGLAPLKAIDEFNYSKYTKDWLRVELAEKTV
jgi:hypothetical protein